MMKVIYVMWLRQLKRYWRSKSRIIGALGQPFFFLIALGFGFGPIYEKAGGGNYIQFLAPGVIAMSILFTSIFNGISLIWDKQFGFLKETLVAPVSRIKIMLGRTLGGATVATLQGVLVLIITLLIGFKIANPLYLPLTLLCMLIISLIFTALGIAIASKLEDMQGFQLIMNFLVMPTFFLSGALFPVKELSGIIEKAVLINPFTYGVDALRGTLTGTFEIGLVIDTLVLVPIMIALMLLGGYLFSKIEI